MPTPARHGVCGDMITRIPAEGVWTPHTNRDAFLAADRMTHVPGEASVGSVSGLVVPI